MKITKAIQKAVLSSLFYERTDKTAPNGQPVYQAKQFPFGKLMDAASAAKKLAEGAEQKDERVHYKDSEVELTPAEVSILKELFDGSKDNFDITVAEAVFELQELFEGK